jgi:nucleoid DNA-binding protein
LVSHVSVTVSPKGVSWKGETVNTTELVAEVAAKVGAPKTLCKKVVRAFVRRITQEVQTGNPVKVAGLGVFYRKLSKARTGRNPQTGEKVKVKEKLIPKFRAGKELKTRVRRGIKKPV